MAHSLQLLVATAIFWTSLGSGSPPQSVEELASHYNEIFKSGNRNAASHLWSAFILKHSESYTPAQLEMLFGGFCPISGSPLPDEPRTRFQVSLADASTGQEHKGITHHCCWPCICDEQSYVRTDTKTISTASGPKQYRFLVIGDPCLHAEKLQSPFKDPFSGVSVTLHDEAPEVKCEDGKLSGAIFSDEGHPILGMFFDEDDLKLDYSKASEFAGQCQARQEQGYNSGMGAIFVKVASMTSLSEGPSLEGLSAISDARSAGSSSSSERQRRLGLLALSAGAFGLFALRRRWTSCRWQQGSEGFTEKESDKEIDDIE